MTAPSKLAKWREGDGLSPRAAARYLRISPETYGALEAGKGECPPSLALDISQRTRMAVLPGDLPGCAVDGDAGEQDAGASDVGSSAPAVGAVTESRYGAAPATIVPCAWAVPSRVLVSMTGKDRDIFTLDPQAAGELGMQLVRAAIAAVRT